jgi:hypothetical protein
MVAFGSFDDICQRASLVICPLVGSEQGIEPICYSRNVEVSGTLIFQPGRFRRVFGRFESCWFCIDITFDGPIAACFVHIVAIIMTAIMILHIRSKYTAVGEWGGSIKSYP